jgi:hypothetical protein
VHSNCTCGLNLVDGFSKVKKSLKMVGLAYYGRNSMPLPLKLKLQSIVFVKIGQILNNL